MRKIKFLKKFMKILQAFHFWCYISFSLPWINTGCFPPSSPTARYAEHFEKYSLFAISHLHLVEGETEEVERWDRVRFHVLEIEIIF